MPVDLAEIVKRTRKPRRKEIVLRPVNMPAMLATDLYQSAYAPVVQAWESVGAAIAAEYARTLSEMQTDAPFDLKVQLEHGESLVIGLAAVLRDRLTRWATRVEVLHRQKWRASVLTATGVDLGTVIGPATARTTVEAAIERNVSLVKSVSEQTRQRISEAVFSGFNKRSPAADVAKAIREAVGMGRRRARNIASDQLVKLASSLDQERRREAGIDTWEWIHSEKAHPRPEHQARNGKRYTDATAPADTPGELPYCGCTSRAVLVL